MIALVFSYTMQLAKFMFQSADASAISPDELAAINSIPADFRECPGSRPLILRLEVCTDAAAAAAAAAAVCFCFCRMILANYFVRISATVLDAKIYNKQRIQANSVCIYHHACHSVAARLPLRCALVHQCLEWGSLELRRFQANEVSFAVLSVTESRIVDESNDSKTC